MASKPNIDEQEKKFVEHYLKTTNAYQSAIAAGYAPASASSSAHLILRRPTVAAALADARKELAKTNAYTIVEAMKECQEAIEFARETENANAMVKAMELKTKLNGLLVEKHDVRAVGFHVHISGIDDQAPPPIDVTATVADEEEDIFE